MTDETNTTNDDEQDTENTESKDTSSETKKTDNHMIPKSRFDEVNNKYKSLASEVAEMRKTQERAEEEQLLADKKFKELYEQTRAKLDEMQSHEDDAQRYRDGLKATIDARLERIPDEKKTLIPDYDDDPIKLGAWLDSNPDLLEPVKPTAPNLDGGSGSGGDSNTSGQSLSSAHQSLADIARQSGHLVSDERIAKHVRNKQKPTDLTGE